MEKLLHVVLEAASGQNSSDRVGRTFFTLRKIPVIVFLCVVILDP